MRSLDWWIIFEYLCHILLVTNNKKLPFYLLAKIFIYIQTSMYCEYVYVYAHKIVYAWRAWIRLYVYVVCFFGPWEYPHSECILVVGWRRCHRHRWLLTNLMCVIVMRFYWLVSLKMTLTLCQTEEWLNERLNNNKKHSTCICVYYYYRFYMPR